MRESAAKAHQGIFPPERLRAIVTALGALGALVGCQAMFVGPPPAHCELTTSRCAGVSTFAALPDDPRHERSGWSQGEVQGIAQDETHWFLTNRRRVAKVPLAAGFPASPDAGIEPFEGRYEHLGDLDVHRGVVFIPMEEDRAGGPPAIGALRSDLTPLGLAPLPGANHASWCAIHPHSGRLYTSDFYDDRVRVFRVETAADHFGLHHERDIVLRKVPGDSRPFGNLPRIQGGVISDSGKLYLSSDRPGYGILVFDAETGDMLGRIPIPYLGKWGPFTREEVQGLTLVDLGRQGQLHLLLHEQTPHRAFWLKHWAVPSGELDRL